MRSPAYSGRSLTSWRDCRVVPGYESAASVAVWCSGRVIHHPVTQLFWLFLLNRFSSLLKMLKMRMMGFCVLFKAEIRKLVL